MNGFESSVVIDQPIEKVFAFLSDLQNDASWRREWIESKMTSDGPIRPGSTFRLVGKALGKEMVAEYETTEYEPNRAAAWKALLGPLPLRFQRSFEREGDATRVDFRYEIKNPSLVLRILRPLVTSMGKRQLLGDFPALLSLMSARGPGESGQ